MDLKPYYEDEKSGIVIYHGDNAELLPHIAKKHGQFDLLLTDPPYGIGACQHHKIASGGSAVTRKKDYGDIHWDIPVDKALIEQALAISKKQIIWGGNYFQLPIQAGWLVWDKDNSGINFADCELAWTNLDMVLRKFRHRWRGMIQEHMGDAKEERYHPTQKPIDLMYWCLRLAKNVKTVIDPFMGSGTTLRACKDLGLNCVGIDIHKEYCDLAIKRLQQECLPFTRGEVMPETETVGKLL